MFLADWGVTSLFDTLLLLLLLSLDAHDHVARPNCYVVNELLIKK